MIGVALDGSRRIQTDRLDDQTDDQSASDRKSAAKASKGPSLALAAHSHALTIATRADQGVTGPARPGWLLGATPQHQRRSQLGQHLAIAGGGRLRDPGRRPADRLDVGCLEAELLGRVA